MVQSAHWMGSGGGTSERGYDSETPTARAIFDPDGRVMVLMTHNTDLGDSWEREGDDPNYFYAEYLVETGRRADAVPYLERALAAPPRPGRQVADEGRRAEARQLLDRARAN